MKTKKWYESKAVWGAVLMFVAGGLKALGYEEIGNLLMTVGASLGIYGVRVAETKIK